MASIPKTHRRVVLVRRPPGEPVESDFRVEEAPVPEPKHGEVLVKVLYLSLDPYQRGRMRATHLLAIDELLGEGCAASAVCLRPREARPSAFVYLTLPIAEKGEALLHAFGGGLARLPIAGDVGGQPGA